MWPRGARPMASEAGGSVTHWIDDLKAGDGAAADPLWDRYFEGLVRLARARLRAADRGAADEVDVALSAFHSLCRGAARGRFPHLDDRDNLWRLLATITAQKAVDHLRRQARLKRGGGRARVGPDPAGDASAGDVLAQV